MERENKYCPIIMIVANPSRTQRQQGRGRLRPHLLQPASQIAGPRAESKCHAPGLVWLPYCLSGLVDSLIVCTIGGRSRKSAAPSITSANCAVSKTRHRGGRCVLYKSLSKYLQPRKSWNESEAGQTHLAVYSMLQV